MDILLTNDDGADSPALRYFAEALEQADWSSSLNVVVPDSERSWIAQAITRFGKLDVADRTWGTVAGKTVSGTPADCTSLGIHNLTSSPPDLVLSGPNMGINAGLPFYLSSGTIGGAAEGFLAGIPSAAVSIVLPSSHYQAWTRSDLNYLDGFGEDWRRISNEGASVLGALAAADAWKDADILSINLPWNVSSSTPRRFTQLRRGGFGPLFKEISPGCYTHELQDMYFKNGTSSKQPSTLPYDESCINDGSISITIIRYDVSTAPSDELRSRIE